MILPFLRPLGVGLPRGLTGSLVLELSIGILCAASFVASVVDAMVGGGGLIQLPALVILLPSVVPGASTAQFLGTNKFVSFCGTLVATANYLRKIPLDKGITLPAGVVAALASFLGAAVARLVPTEWFRGVVLVLLFLVGAYTLKKKDLGTIDRARMKPQRELVLAMVMGGAIGFYDGFLGPGTGSFLLFLLVSVFGLSFLRASASAKVINMITNFAALCYFLPSGAVVFEVAIPMALCNVLGALVGSQLAMKKGSAFVRYVFLGIISLIAVKISYDIFSGYRR